MSEEQSAKKPDEQPAPESSPATPEPASVSTASAEPSTAAKAPEPEQTLKLSSEEFVKRRSRWQSSLAALRYVSSIARDSDVKLRDSDRSTSIALLIVCAFALAALVVPQLATWRVGLVGAADVLVGVVLMMYVANRFGIVTTFTPRQAILTYQLMLGMALLGIFLAINLGMLIAYQMATTHIEVPGS
jgi:hypothetical protein